MRRLYPLTPEEQEFAAIHIDLVDTFLRRERLDPNEYYDIVIFGYLEAVQKQHREPIEEERQNGRTSTLWQKSVCAMRLARTGNTG